MATFQTDKPDEAISDAQAAWVAKCVTEAGYDNEWIQKSVRNVAGHFLANGYIKTADVALDQAAVVVGAILKMYGIDELAKRLK